MAQADGNVGVMLCNALMANQADCDASCCVTMHLGTWAVYGLLRHACLISSTATLLVVHPTKCVTIANCDDAFPGAGLLPEECIT